MEAINSVDNYLFTFMVFCLLMSSTSCNTLHQVEEVKGNYTRVPVFAKSLLDISQGDPRLINLQRISHAYASSRDSFVITLFDMNENESFVDSKDVIVVSSIKDSVAPTIPDVNINAAFFAPNLKFEFYGNQYQVVNASSDGAKISINRIKTSQEFKPQIIVTDQISNDLIITEIDSAKSVNLLRTVQEQNRKYVLLYFWSHSCASCFENIPILRKFENDGVGIINIFYIKADQVSLIEKQILRFDIPGINFRSSPDLVKYFSQNGFPYSVLVDASTNRILSSSHHVELHESFLKY